MTILLTIHLLCRNWQLVCGFIVLWNNSRKDLNRQLNCNIEVVHVRIIKNSSQNPWMCTCLQSPVVFGSYLLLNQNEPVYFVSMLCVCQMTISAGGRYCAVWVAMCWMIMCCFMLWIAPYCCCSNNRMNNRMVICFFVSPCMCKSNAYLNIGLCCVI